MTKISCHIALTFVSQCEMGCFKIFLVLFVRIPYIMCNSQITCCFQVFAKIKILQDVKKTKSTLNLEPFRVFSIVMVLTGACFVYQF